MWSFLTIGEVVRDLGEMLHLDSGTLSPLLKRLEAAGRVVRTRDVDDERRVLVGLTDAGRALERGVADVPARLWAAMGITEADAIALRDRLGALLESLESRR